MPRTQIAERLDAGDRAGAVRLAAREKIAKIQQAQKSELDLQIAAIEELVRRYPEFNNEFYGGQIRLSLQEMGFRGISVEEMERALQHVQEKLAPVAEYEARRQAAAETTATVARQSQSERRAERRAASAAPEDSVTAEAKQLILEGRITRESIAPLISLQYERAISSPVFNRALELLEPRREPSMLTLGEVQRAHGQAHRLNQQEQRTVITADIVQ